MSAVASPAVFTIGQVADQLGQPIHRIEYAVKARRIEPVGRAGIYRLYGRSEVKRIAAALAEASARRRPA